ncbi:MAG: hypothetical protein ACLP59_10255 [Bryobacteraceae bacterium]
MLVAFGAPTQCLPAAQTGARAYLTGTTVPNFPSQCNVIVNMTGDQEMLFVTQRLTLHVPYDKVNTVEYGQHVGRRYLEAVLISPLFLLAKSRKHYVTVGYLDANGRQQALVLQVGKGDVRAILAELEAKTGRRVEYTDDAARQGRG